MSRWYCRILISMCAALLVASCAGTYLGSPRVPGQKTFKHLLRASATPADSNYLRETEALFHIVDRRFCIEHLHSAPDMAAFAAQVATYADQRDYETRPDTPDKNEWWEEMQARMAYGRERYATTIYYPLRDIRWEHLIQLGIPTFEKRVPGDTSDERYILYWHHLGREVACISGPGGGYPIKTIPMDFDEKLYPRFLASPYIEFLREQAEVFGTAPEVIAFPELEKPIRSSIRLAVFPDSDSLFSLWVTTLTRGDQFTDSSVQSGELNLELLLYDSARTLVARQSVRSGGLGALARVAKSKEFAIPIYVGQDSLRAGHYEAVIALTGSGEENSGVYRADVVIPSTAASSGASDLLVLFPPGEVMQSGIRRHQGCLPANPSPTFSPQDTLHLYAEFAPLGDTGGQVVSAWLIPIPQLSRGANEVTAGPIFRTEDTLGRVWSESLPPLPVEHDQKVTRQSNRGTLVFRSSYPDINSTAVFEESIPLEYTRTGRYYLVVRVTGSEGQTSRLAWAELKIK